MMTPRRICQAVGTLAVLATLMLAPQQAAAVTTTYKLDNGWAPYGNENGIYFYKPGAAFYGDFSAGGMFLEMTQTSATTYDARIYGEFYGYFQTQNGQLSVNPADNANQFNSTEGIYSLDFHVELQQNFPHKYPNNFSTFSEELVGTITNPLGQTSSANLMFADRHGISLGVTINPDGSILSAGWFMVAGGAGFTGVVGDFYFTGTPFETGGGGGGGDTPPAEVPEPGSLLLLTAGGIGLLRRKLA